MEAKKANRRPRRLGKEIASTTLHLGCFAAPRVYWVQYIFLLFSPLFAEISSTLIMLHPGYRNKCYARIYSPPSLRPPRLEATAIEKHKCHCRTLKQIA